MPNLNDVPLGDRPAFTSGPSERLYAGLTKREVFAGMAMQALIASGCDGNFYIGADVGPVAVQKANELLRELSKEKTNDA